MRIVLIGPVYPYKGGISHYTSLLYKALSKTNEVELISYKIQYPKILYHNEQRDFDDDLFKIDDVRFFIHTARPFNIIGTSKIINKLNPDVVLFQWWHPYFAPCYAILIRHLKKSIKVYFTCHNVFPHERFLFDKTLTRWVLKKGDGFIVQSKSDEKDLLSIKKDANERCNPHPTYNVFKIRNITKKEAREEIILKDGFTIADNTKLLLFFGFVREYKGLKHLLKAMAQIVSAIPECRLMVIGAFGDDRKDYLDIIEAQGVKEYIYLKDTYTPDKEVEKYFAASDIVVLPYEDATQSGIAQIAYGFEKPVLVTNVGGLPDVVTDGKTGYVVEPFNPEAIAQGVIDFFENDRYELMHEEIKKEAYRFSWDHMVESIESL